MKKLMVSEQKPTVLERSERVRVQTINTEPTMTQQQFKDECDINNIMKKFGNDPVAFQALTRPGGQYADFSHITDYQGMLDTVLEAQHAFESLPAPTRARFRNDPGNLLSFLQDEKNRDEAVSLGLLPPKLVPSISTPPANNQTKTQKKAPIQNDNSNDE